MCLHDTYAMALSPVMWLLWWCLPLTKAIHTFKSCRRETAPRLPMPRVRVAWALTLIVATVAGRASGGISTVEPGDGMPSRYTEYLPDFAPVAMAAHDGTMMALGLLVAVLGAWSRRGAHRRLFSERVTRSLAAIVLLMHPLLVVITPQATLLLVAVAVGLITVAGAAEPLPRTRE